MTSPSRVKVAAIQLTSSDDAAANMANARRLLEQAAHAGAKIALLPENVALMGRREADKFAIAEDEGSGPLQQALSDAARDCGLWVVGGTLPIKLADETRVAAAVLVFDESGKQVARYDKMHLFDVSVAERGETYRESASIAPGAAPVVVDTPAGPLGLSVCYDLRFPELFRSLAAAGARWFVVPAAFTVPTGRAHWETLLRARAIENLAFVVAAGQTGLHPNGRETWGDSMIIDHWGAIQSRLPRGEGVVVAEFDLAAQAQVRAEFPVLSHRRL